MTMQDGRGQGMLGMVVNAARRLESMFPGYFTDTKHTTHYRDYGFPETLSFIQFLKVYQRNGLGKAAVSRTVKKTWQDSPFILTEEEAHEETEAEKAVRERLEELRFWQMVATADRRSLVGRYAGIIFRFADSKDMDQPVDTVPGGLEGLVEIIPVWEGQLKIAEWDDDLNSDTYGKPKMFSFSESALSSGEASGAGRQFNVHPDRAVIWSEDGTIYGEAFLEAGFNDLVTLEKVIGAGGEGFWKNAKSAPHLNVSPDAKLRDLAAMLGVPEDEIADKMGEIVEDWQKGFDKLLMTQGIDAKTLDVMLPQPEQYVLVALQSFAASVDIPVKILVGSQTGERASSEDHKEWSQTCQSRRENIVIPALRGIVKRLVRFGVLPEGVATVVWSDLTESTMAEKIERADKMASVNQKMASYGRVVFEGDEIRETVDLPALGDRYGDDDEEAAADAMREAGIDQPEED